MSNVEVAIEQAQQQVASAQSRISELTQKIEVAGHKMAAGEDIAIDIANATLQDVHAQTDAMNANIAELIMGLDDITAVIAHHPGFFRWRGRVLGFQ